MRTPRLFVLLFLLTAGLLTACGPSDEELSATSSGLTIYTVADGLAGEGADSIVVGPDGDLWFGGWGLVKSQGLSRFDGQNWTAYSADDGLASEDIADIFVDPQGDLWFGTTDHGVSRFDGQTWTTYVPDDSTACPSVREIAVAPDGTLWIGSSAYKPEEAGLCRFDGQTWTTYTSDNGLPRLDKVWPNSVSSVAVTSDGILWIGYDRYASPSDEAGGLTRFDGQTWTTFKTDDGLTSDRVSSIELAPDNSLWVGTWAGVSRFDGQTWTNYPIRGVVVSIAFAPDGTVWFGTDNGALSFDGQTWTSYPPDVGLPHPRVNGLAVEPDGTVWFGTPRGVASYSPPQYRNSKTDSTNEVIVSLTSISQVPTHEAFSCRLR